MLSFSKYGINYNPETDYNIRINDLIAIGNIDRSIVETKVIEDNNTSMVILGEYAITDSYVVVGGEIIKVISSLINTIDNTTTVTVERALKGTLQENWVGYNFRTVILVDEFNNEIDLIEWSFEDSIGSVTNTLFPVELTGGSVTLKSDLSLWSPNSLARKYRVRPKKGIVYIFRGIDDKRFLKFTTVISKVGFNTRAKNDPNRIRLELKTKLAKWYDKDLSINKQLKGTTPKEFFKLVFGLSDDEVYYAEGVSEDSFLKINNLSTKEYKTMSELLKGYCSNGTRFCFDAFERVKIFSDFKVDTINSQKTIYYDLTESTLTEEESMIYNTININSVQRQTMFNFEDLGNKYVSFAKKLNSIVNSNTFIKIEENGDYNFNNIQITNESLSNSCQIGDFVCFKRTVAPYYEYNARVIDIGKNNVVTIVPILYDKDFKTLYYGKYAYLYNILNNQICQMDLYYVRQELPMIFKYTRNKGGEERDASLMYPILPKVNGEVLYPQETNITFGSASNLKIGEYTGIIEEVDGVYGTWDSSKLLYNSEIDQFGNTLYPPIFLLTNKVNERITAEGTPLLNYTHFDNSDFLLEVRQPQDTQNDATLVMYNMQTVNKDIDLFVGEEISRPSNLILEVASLTPYKIGDVLICNRPEDLTPQEETEYDEVLSSIRWTIIGKETQVNPDTLTEKHYIYLDSKFAKRQIQGKKYTFTKFPNWSVVFLQELYFRGNPVIQFSQEVVGISKGVNYDGDRSTDIYGEKKYEFDSKQIGKEDMKMMMGYILDNFQATDLNSTKFNAPISTFNGIEIELLDVITVIDPTYTKITDKSKWLVVSVTNKSRTNTVQLKLINVNATNTKAFKIDVKDVLEYRPVEIPNYDHNGNEGNGGGDNDGSGGDGIDKTIGVFNMAEVDPKKFRAKVDRAEGNYIYFTDLSGTEWETYSSKLFPNSEFGISIDGETMLVRSDMNYRAFIKKRDIYNTGERILISAGADVKFLVMSSFTDIDGTFYSRKCMIGDGDTYFAFDTITGAKFVGDFVVGETNQNIDNDLWVSLQNNRTFRQNTPPVTTTNYKLKEGDIWYDTDDGNHPYVYNGSIWISARDQIFLTEGGNKVYFQNAEPPKTGEGTKDGDMWFKTNENNKMFLLLNRVWTLADDSLDKINTGRIILNGNTTVNGDFKVKDGNVELGGNTKVYGTLEVFGGTNGIMSYNGTSEASSTKRIIIRGGEIVFQEKI